ncbi:MAG TPA: cytochrome c oxidase subunit II [Chloroflexota bacterium]|nr:cytochrome c oxidase subunit II [Chloroflexota bacterium]
MFSRGRAPSRRGLRRWWQIAIVLLVVALVLAGCNTGNPQSTIDPRGPAARLIYDLFVTWIFWPAVFVFFAVEGLLLYAIFRFRGRPGDPLPPQIHGNTRLEITWTIIPALILIVILAMTFRTQAALATPPPADALTVRVIGHQWWWEFEYPELGVTTANELHIPVGVPIRVQLESVDVIHSFWVPHLAGKMDAIPGRINAMTMQADEAGTYNGQCAEFCGIEHALMRLVVVAQSRAEFDAWVRNERSIPAFSATPTAGAGADASLVARGAQLFSTGACITCHTLRGTPAQARTGPDLTHFGSRQTIAANTLPNTPENLRRWLRNPQAVKPGNLMPNLNLSDQDVEALAAYLQSLK